MARDGAADRLILVGAVTAPHGVQGAVKVKSFTADPEALAVLPLHDQEGRRVRLKVLSARGDVLIARIAGTSDRNAAERLRGTRLFVPREALDEPDEDEFYHADLIGLRAERADGSLVGTVAAMHDFGAGDLVEVKTEAGKAVLLPFDRDTVPVVDVAGGRLVVDPPHGLIDGEDGAPEEGAPDGEDGEDGTER
ncbi:MAG: hypothetical protein CMM50_07085 [Rhodospirillaceae bacterium]|nr:hypothetical protein [Rhodospirillaceae bacterium]